MIYAAHLCADASMIQNFPGAPERVARLRALGAASPLLSGPIVDEVGLSEVDDPGTEPFDLLINLGGFQNFLLDYDTHNQYLELISRWVPELVAERPDFRRVAVCGGGYGGPGCVAADRCVLSRRRWPCGWLRTCGGSGESAATSAKGAGGSKRPSRRAHRRPPRGPRRSTGLVCWHATSPTTSRRGRRWRRAWPSGGSSVTRRAHPRCSSIWALWRATRGIILKLRLTSRRACA